MRVSRVAKEGRLPRTGWRCLDSAPADHYAQNGDEGEAKKPVKFRSGRATVIDGVQSRASPSFIFH
jgi:hypothetical protein